MISLWVAPWENVPFGKMRTAKAQIRLRIRAVWSSPSLFAYRFIEYCRKTSTVQPLYNSRPWSATNLAVLNLHEMPKPIFWAKKKVKKKKKYRQFVVCWISPESKCFISFLEVWRHCANENVCGMHCIHLSNVQKSRQSDLSYLITVFSILSSLTHLCRVDSSTLTLWTGSFPI